MVKEYDNLQLHKLPIKDTQDGW